MSLSLFSRDPMPGFFTDDFDHMMWPSAFRSTHPTRQNQLQRSMGGALESFNGLGSMDIHKSDNGWEVRLDTPGLTDADISVEAHPDNRLTISGERKSEVNDEAKGYFERSYGKFTRTITLSDDADADNIKGHVENGVLLVSVPKKAIEDKKATKSIPITMAK
jgi:HSP20 family protein